MWLLKIHIFGHYYYTSNHVKDRRSRWFQIFLMFFITAFQFLNKALNFGAQLQYTSYSPRLLWSVPRVLLHGSFSVFFGSAVWKLPHNQQDVKSSKLVLLVVMDRLRHRHLQSEFRARVQLLMGPSFSPSWTHILWARNLAWMQTLLQPSTNIGAFCISDTETP
jgi:hypothetical protein